VRLAISQDRAFANIDSISLLLPPFSFSFLVDISQVTGCLCVPSMISHQEYPEMLRVFRNIRILDAQGA
jgi:hypothetical protein